MIKELIKLENKATHVFLKDDNSFTTVSKRRKKGMYEVYTSMKLKFAQADEIEGFADGITIKRMNTEKGFILIKLDCELDYTIIVKAIEKVLYGKS